MMVLSSLNSVPLKCLECSRVSFVKRAPYKLTLTYIAKYLTRLNLKFHINTGKNENVN